MMKLKTYYATDMPEALKQIKEDLGPEALIVQSRKARKAGFRGYFQKPVLEVQAAIDDSPTETAMINNPGLRLPNKMTMPTSGYGFGDHAFPYRDIKGDIDELKVAVNKLTRQARTNQVFQSPVLSAVFQHLIRQEVEEELAQDLILAVSEELSPQALRDIGSVKDSVTRHLASRICVGGPVRLTPGKPKTVFVMGPTGVGKTTTIAKIAAEFALIQRKQVVLVTTDTFRIAAIPQLETYAKIIGIPIEVAYRPEDMSRIVAAHANKDLILVDTPGRSQRNANSLEELHSFVNAVPQREVYLTVSAATKFRDMLDISDRFGIVPFQGLIITKLDETDGFGPVFSLAVRTEKPISYVTNGQNVPNDIEVAASGQLATLAFQNRAEGVAV